MKELDLDRYSIVYYNSLYLADISEYIKQRNCDVEYLEKTRYDVADLDETYLQSKIQPDGGVLWLKDKLTFRLYPILISELKYQGTNKGRQKNKLKAQAAGNAIERGGKYAVQLQSLFQYESSIFPYCMFVYGDDFSTDSNGLPNSVASQVCYAKLISMQPGLNKLNTVYTSDNIPNSYNHICKPYTIMAREDKWTSGEMVKILLQLSSDSIQYYINNVIPVVK